MNSHTDAQQHFRSNRKHLRVDSGLECQVGKTGSKQATAKVLDISIGGMKFECTHEIVNSIIPEGERTVGLIMDVVIDVQIKLPSDSKRATRIKTTARIVHSERLAQDVFHVGVQFTGLDHNAARQLETYIQHLGQ